MSSIQQEIFRINAMDISQEEKAKKIFRVFNPIKIIEKKKICNSYLYTLQIKLLLFNKLL